mgnify:CR=1 FL=1
MLVLSICFVIFVPQKLSYLFSSAFIDYNRHLNNAYYAMFTEDWLGEKMQTPVRMKEIQINFNHTTGFGEHLLCSGKLSGEDFYVEGILAGEKKMHFRQKENLKK